jgi:membrane-associated protein
VGTGITTLFSIFVKNASVAEAWELFQKLINPESIIHYGGMVLLFVVIFMENGVFFGFFLPGDSLLFTAGLLCATGILQSPIEMVILNIGVGAVKTR